MLCWIITYDFNKKIFYSEELIIKNVCKTKEGYKMIVYHYCSIDTFTAIIKNKTLRLSEITRSNDSMEILWITRFIEEVFRDVYNKYATKKLNDKFSETAFMEMVDHIKSDFFDEENRIYSFFVTCFSEADEGDLLSQWRGYADDGKGVAIGFDGDVLKQIGQPAPDDTISNPVLYFDKVEYTERSQKAAIRRIASQLIDTLNLSITKDKTDDIGTLKYQSMNSFNSYFLELFKQSVFMKNPFFREEREYRLCFWTDTRFTKTTKPETERIHLEDGLKFEKLMFQNKSGKLVSYVDLNFGDSKKQLIKEIIIGPKSLLTKSDVISYLYDNDIDINNKDVILSKGTYR